MSISFIGPGGSCEYPWIHYALLRDNVLHHCEAGQLSLAFSEIYKISSALAGVPAQLSATKLRAELLSAKALVSRPISDLAISARTRAVLQFEQMLPLGPPTQIVGSELNLPWLAEGPESLGDVFGDLVQSLFLITEQAKDTDRVEVIET